MLLWLKAWHVIFMVSWFAGLFYLPRLFVYHAAHPAGPVHEQFCVMERKLYRYIMTPAMVLTVAFGLWQAALEWEMLADAPWFWAKMALVVLLIAYHGHNGRVVRDFAAGRNRRDARFYRIYNELPTLVLIAAVILVVVRPF